jgi:putative peptidoglycan lipid II flippase
MRETLGGIFALLIFLTLPAAVLLILLRLPLVTLLLQRGAFDAADTQLTAYVLAFFTLGLVGHSVVEIAARGFYALKDTLTPVLVGLAAMTTNIVLSVVLVRPLGVGGLALANSIATLAEMALLMVLLRRRLGGWEERRVLRSLLHTLAATLLMAAVTIGLLRLGQGWPLPLQAVVVGGVAIAVYAAAAWAFRSPEARALPGLLRRQK